MNVDRRTAIRTFAGATCASLLEPLADLAPGACGFKDLPGFASFCFRSGDITRQVYVADGGGPPVILLHELPGLIDADLNAAKCLSEGGYTIVAPLLFGEPGGDGAFLRYYREVCGKERFACGKGNVTSPEVAWLLELTRDVRRRWAVGKGLGVIGMCLTGAFPLAMLREPSVTAVVLCQPTIPFNSVSFLRLFTDKRGLGISPDDLAHAKSRADVPVLGIRYTGDWRCPRQRFERLHDEFKGRFYRMDIEGKHHSTLGGDFSQEALLEVLAYLNARLPESANHCVDSFPRRSENNSRTEVRVKNCECHVPKPCKPSTARESR